MRALATASQHQCGTTTKLQSLCVALACGSPWRRRLYVRGVRLSFSVITPACMTFYIQATFTTYITNIEVVRAGGKERQEREWESGVGGREKEEEGGGTAPNESCPARPCNERNSSKPSCLSGSGLSAAIEYSVTPSCTHFCVQDEETKSDRSEKAVFSNGDNFSVATCLHGDSLPGRHPSTRTHALQTWPLRHLARLRDSPSLELP